MRQLQSNFTTIEQAKQLIKLGLPVDSADMFYAESKQSINDGPLPLVISNNKKYSSLFLRDYEVALPCWSVGRLIEILRICVTDEEELVEIMENLIYWTLLDLTDFLLQTYQEYKEVIDFSKLED